MPGELGGHGSRGRRAASGSAALEPDPRLVAVADLDPPPAMVATRRQVGGSSAPRARCSGAPSPRRSDGFGVADVDPDDGQVVVARVPRCVAHPSARARARGIEGVGLIAPQRPVATRGRPTSAGRISSASVAAQAVRSRVSPLGTGRSEQRCGVVDVAQRTEGERHQRGGSSVTTSKSPTRAASTSSGPCSSARPSTQSSARAITPSAS